METYFEFASAFDPLDNETKTRFRQLSNRLLKTQTFCSTEGNEVDFYFYDRYKELFAYNFALLGWTFYVSREGGYFVYLTTDIDDSSFRHRYNYIESLIVFILLRTYVESMNSDDLREFVSISVGDLKSALFEIGYPDRKLKKTTFETSLMNIKKFAVISFKRDGLDDQTRIYIYPTLHATCNYPLLLKINEEIAKFRVDLANKQNTTEENEDDEEESFN
jgi:hypothetical protein